MMTHTSNFTSFQSFQPSSFVFILLRIFKKKESLWVLQTDKFFERGFKPPG